MWTGWATPTQPQGNSTAEGVELVHISIQDKNHIVRPESEVRTIRQTLLSSTREQRKSRDVINNPPQFVTF